MSSARREVRDAGCTVLQMQGLLVQKNFGGKLGAGRDKESRTWEATTWYMVSRRAKSGGRMVTYIIIRGSIRCNVVD